MTSKTIDLSISGISVSLRLFNSEDYPRVAADDGASVAYSANGATIGRGRLYEPKHLWDLTTYCTQAEEEMLRLIWAEHDHLRRSLQPCNILVVDRTQVVEERLPRTRAIAPGSTAIYYPITGTATHILYCAQFYAWMTAKPKFSRVGLHRQAIFTLTETDKVPA